MFIDSALIANPQLYALVSSVTKCVICEGILYNPLKCTICENSFCKACINTWKLQSKCCPFQCVNQEYIPSKYLQRILSKLSFFCEKGCLEVIDYNDLEKHKNIICPNINLRESVMAASVTIEKLKKENDLLLKINKSLMHKMESLSLHTKKKDTTIITKRHQHPLSFVYSSTNCVCQRCHKLYPHQIKMSCCSKCNFYLCAKCYFDEFMSSN